MYLIFIFASLALLVPVGRDEILFSYFGRSFLTGIFLQNSHVGGSGRMSFRLPNGYILPEGKVTPNALFVGGIDVTVRIVKTACMLF